MNKGSKKLEGKIAVITGGNSGMGLATAQRFVDEGAHVVMTGRRENELARAAELIGKNVTTVIGDVSHLADLDHLFAVVKEKHGHIDILFANAGGGTLAPLATSTEAQFDSTFDINVKGVFLKVQKALPIIKGGGSIETDAMNKVGLSPEQVDQAVAHFASQVPLGRRGRPEESSFITGVDLAVDGGMAQVEVRI